MKKLIVFDLDAEMSALLHDLHDATLYPLLGDWFPWITLATLFFTLAQLYRSRNSRTYQSKAAQDHADHVGSSPIKTYSLAAKLGCKRSWQ